MRSTNPVEYPLEMRLPDLRDCGVIQEYELQCDEYPGAYAMSQYMDNMDICDYSRPQDDFYLLNGIIYSNWVIFFMCRPKDAARLAYVARQLNSRHRWAIHIKSYGLEDLV